MPTTKSEHPSEIYEDFRSKGWTIRTAATLLGVHYSHLHHVLSGYRDSARLTARIIELPFRNLTGKQSKQQNR